MRMPNSLQLLLENSKLKKGLRGGGGGGGGGG